MPKAAERRLFRPEYTLSAEIALFAERSMFAETFLLLPKPKLSDESRKRALSVDHYRARGVRVKERGASETFSCTKRGT